MAVVYKTLDVKTNKIYIGVDSQNNPAYFGSGTEIKNIIASGRISDLRKTILFNYNNIEDAFIKEAEIVTENFIKRADVMNIALGGNWGKYSIGRITAKDKNNNIYNISKNDIRLKNGELSGIQKNKVSVIDRDGNNLSVSINDERYKSGDIKHNLKGRKWMNNPKTGHKTLVFKDDIIKYLNSGYLSGQGKIRKLSNQTGMKLINNGIKNTRIHSSKLSEYIDNGWQLGWINIKERKDAVNKKGP